MPRCTPTLACATNPPEADTPAWAPAPACVVLEEADARAVASPNVPLVDTIANADDIFFVNGTQVTEAGSMEHAVEMLLHGKRKS